jgi:hypothetical protein
MDAADRKFWESKGFDFSGKLMKEQKSSGGYIASLGDRDLVAEYRNEDRARGARRPQTLAEVRQRLFALQERLARAGCDVDLVG